MAGLMPLDLLSSPQLAVPSSTLVSGEPNPGTQPRLEKLYKCDYCVKGFKKSSTLSYHVRSHTGEKPYKCDHCDRRFMQQSHLVGHLRSHTGDRPYKCGFCQRGFFTASHLTQHSKIHTCEKSFKCDVCSQFFSQYETLAEHMQIHSKPRPFKCDFCEKGFTSSSNLTKHKRIHTKPCKCPVCNKGFVRNSEVARHMRTHTNENASEPMPPAIGTAFTLENDFLQSYNQVENTHLVPEMSDLDIPGDTAAAATVTNSDNGKCLPLDHMQHLDLSRTLIPLSYHLVP